MKLVEARVEQIIRAKERRDGGGPLVACDCVGRGVPADGRLACHGHGEVVTAAHPHRIDARVPPLAKRHQIYVGKETLRGWMTEAGLWKSKTHAMQEVHVWRPRRSGFGEPLSGHPLEQLPYPPSLTPIFSAASR